MSPRALALIGAAWGTLGAGALVGQEMLDGPGLRVEPLGSLAEAVAVLAPFLLALAVARARQPVRAGVWLGSGLAGLWLAATALSITTFVLLPAAVLLLVGGAMDLGTPRLGWLSALFAVAVLAAAVGGVFARSITTDVRCWKLVRTPTGQEWRAAEPEIGPGIGLTLTEGEIEGQCTSDAVSGTEAGVIFGGWAFVGLAVAATGRARRPSVPAEGVA